MRRSNYEKFPLVPIAPTADACAVGWDAIGARLNVAIRRRDKKKTVVVVECYPGVIDEHVLPALIEQLRPVKVIESKHALKCPDDIDALVQHDVTNDPVFGHLTQLQLSDFLGPSLVTNLYNARNVDEGVLLIYGVGASIGVSADILVYADLARWEAQMRFRRNEISNLGVENRELKWSLQYKRAFFVDWRIADRHKKLVLDDLDFLLDTNAPDQPKMITGDDFRAALRATARRPFRVVPFFDPAPWGGQWMKEVCDLDRSPPNYGWCFDCVPEENSLLLGFGDARVEVPAIDLVFYQPRELLGDAVHARFGTEFPIRFDFLDTMGGGNLSLQVHPLTEYVQDHFGMHYTQDESYYMLDAGDDAVVYLGLKDDADVRMLDGLEAAADDASRPFDAERYVNKWPAKKHDHFLIPAGTVHCSGANGMVLEISATPYIFTFKMWDWGRLGLDGQPRPIHLRHASENIQWDRTTEWTRANLVNRVEPIAAGDGWREERTGLHEREFIETRRRWFDRRVLHKATGGVNVLNLVEGEEAIVESPTGAFPPLVVHYAETFIVPAAAGDFTIAPHGASVGRQCATMKAYVRT